jgi:hypothetical protein
MSDWWVLPDDPFASSGSLDIQEPDWDWADSYFDVDSSSYWDASFDDAFSGFSDESGIYSPWAESQYDPSTWDRIEHLARIAAPVSASGSSDESWNLNNVWDTTKDAASSAFKWLTNTDNGAGFLKGMATGGLSYLGSSLQADAAKENADLNRAQSAEELAFRYAQLAQQTTDAERARELQAAAIEEQGRANEIKASALEEEKRKLRAHNDTINAGPSGKPTTYKFKK